MMQHMGGHDRHCGMSAFCEFPSPTCLAANGQIHQLLIVSSQRAASSELSKSLRGLVHCQPPSARNTVIWSSTRDALAVA